MMEEMVLKVGKKKGLEVRKGFYGVENRKGVKARWKRKQFRVIEWETTLKWTKWNRMEIRGRQRQLFES
jgi:hypothetical protein